jgi:hypothetical protein
MRFWVVVLLTLVSLSAAGQVADVTSHILSGGVAGKKSNQLAIPGFSGQIKWNGSSGSSVRSKGGYVFGGFRVGELVLRMDAGAIIEESLDIPLVSAEDLPEKRTAQAVTSVRERNHAAELLGVLQAKLGAPAITYDQPGQNGESNRAIAVWRGQGGDRKIYWRLELFFSDDNKFLTGKDAHFARITIGFCPDLESVIFDPSIFSLRDFELYDKLAITGLDVSGKSRIEAKIMGATAQISVNAKLNRLQDIQIAFTDYLRTNSIVLKKYGDDFLDAANTVLSSRLRSYPTELSKRHVNYQTRDYEVTDPATGDVYVYTDVLEYRSREVMLVWSPGRGAANYRLAGNVLQILPPGLTVSRAIDPTMGGLTGGDVFTSAAQAKDFNLPVLSFADFSKNVQRGRLGTWIDIPMENQGDLPLCLPASMARILRYFGRQVNQFTVAQVGGVGMRGTDWIALRQIIDTSCERFGLKVRARKQDENLGAFIKQNIDNGLPILWLIPGHARIINGYNTQTKSVLYTDSWGAGFEVQSMPYAEAERITQFAFVFLPPGAIK